MNDKNLSIAIPTRNDDCSQTVSKLLEQARRETSLDFEILIADDASDNAEVIRQLNIIGNQEGCRLIRLKENVGRSAVRNQTIRPEFLNRIDETIMFLPLTKQEIRDVVELQMNAVRNMLAREAKYDKVLFIDAGVDINNQDFLKTYILHANDADIVCGGWKTEVGAETAKANLRAKYELSCEKNHTPLQRNKHPYRSFRTVNFLVHKDILLNNPFPADMTGYGYEDVVFGKQAEKAGCTVLHIDNPVVYKSYEDNEAFVSKTIQSVNTLYIYRERIGQYSKLHSIAFRLRKLRLDSLMVFLYKQRSETWKKQLCGNCPSLRMLSLLKLGCYLSLLGNDVR